MKITVLEDWYFLVHFVSLLSTMGCVVQCAGIIVGSVLLFLA